ncbi:translation elongation factor Ts, partial [Oscillospiraceae bacterium OttesenSCG-928-G22]|nr:translation elongation factor Ts [Oscillospiraceae bacterium OttesenSCG-928-G22]
EMTGVGMMDCKKALTETDGDIDAAVKYLREKGLAAAAKKAGRVAAEGAVYAYVDESTGVGAIVEVNSETDFVAKNDDFQAFCRDVAKVVCETNPADLAALLAAPFPGGSNTVEEVQRDKVLVIGENIQVRRFARYATGMSVPYVHMGGKIGVLVNLEVSDNLKGNATVTELGKDLAMQIAAMRPKFLSPDDVDQSTIDAEREILMAQVKEEGKPEKVAEKIVSGRIGKYYEENCLLKQAFVKENKVSVEAYVARVAKELSGSIAVKAFIRFEKGEGIEKKVDNLADEVAKMIQ